MKHLTFTRYYVNHAEVLVVVHYYHKGNVLVKVRVLSYAP